MAEQRTGWVGWIWFAAIMSVIIGAFNVIDGLVALFHNTLYVVGQNQVLAFDLTTWGWIHLIVGALQVIAGFALFTGKMWARVTVGVLVVINAIAQMAFLPVYPVWSLLVIALDVIVLYAVVVHGGEARPVDGGAGYSAGYMAGAGGSWESGASGRHADQAEHTGGAPAGAEAARPPEQRAEHAAEQHATTAAQPAAPPAAQPEPGDRRVAGPDRGGDGSEGPTA